ncbi:helix-turn-helix transcriptional regulator [Streptomyces bacillaris]|uniref:helix-turn-helix domain-containing protein n=1 Tax=Streptomyces bacillaris TaxID=68179 RepID=UPI00345FECD8
MPPDRVRARRLELGEHIRAAREHANLTQEAVSLRTGVRIATISDIELGHRAALIDTLFRIADAIGVPLADLVREERPPLPREVQGPPGLPDPGPP